MNRLIIIGNGFDLAHGLKTSFKHFIADYLDFVYNDFHHNKIFDDILLKITSSGEFIDDTNDVIEDNSIMAFQRLIGTKGVRVIFKTKFIENIIKKISIVNWVDIEVEYYQNLKLCKDGRFNVRTLNTQFEFLKNRLFDYLKTQEKQCCRRIAHFGLMDCFSACFNEKEMLEGESVNGLMPKNIYFLNFNYTNVLYEYFTNLKGDFSTDINYIHGSLDCSLGDPIFGFGDEFDKNYTEFEDLNDNEYFKYMKSFQYSKNHNYFKLLGFLESDDFQVQIFGHSCGISDRTMLRTIFEHVRCKSIKVFYHGGEGNNNDFLDKLYNISRHFKDKTLLRKKVVPYDMCKPMPQPAKEYEVEKNGQRSKK